MSLLMEALKKAERAKGQVGADAESAVQPSDTSEAQNSLAAPDLGLSLLPHDESAKDSERTGVDPLPAIQDMPAFMPDLTPQTEVATPALEFALAEPPPPKAALASPAPIAALAIEPEPRPQPAENTKPSASKPPEFKLESTSKPPAQDTKKIAAAQQKAKAVFTAKQPARNRTMLLAGTAAVIVLGMVAFGVYYWQISSSSSSLIPANAPQPAIVAAPPPPVDAGVSQQQSAPATLAQSPANQPALASDQSHAPATYDATRPEARQRSDAARENPAIRIQQSAATSQLNPNLGKAYQSFLSGDTGTAQQLYHKVLQQEANNRDALLGMAAIALKNKQAGQAAAYYSKLLELDPADPEAQAGLVGLQGQADPEQSESRLKKVLLQNSQADAAQFALGNLYMQQSRWAEAQQAYFRAYSSVPSNADYAFNLAVSLDHLNQGKLALDYYQRAIAQPGPSNFDKSSVQTRIKELLQPVGN